jgi:uncharacterized protein (TIGR03083 family)
MNAGLDRRDVAVAFDAAVEWFLTVVARIDPDQWAGPGLGTWTVRELVGHAGRALSTVEDYLSLLAPGAPDPGGDDDPVAGAASYFLGLRDNAPLHADVAERGRQAGLELPAGPGALAALAVRATRVRALVADAPERAVFVTRFGSQPFSTYLLTRTVELVVHGVDVASACASALDIPAPAASAAVAVVGELAVRRGSAGEVLRALVGRGALSPAFDVFS